MTRSPLPPTQMGGCGFLDALRLVDRAVDPVVLAGERGVRLGPHGPDDLERLLQHAETLGDLRERVPVRVELVLVPARADPEVEAAVAEHVHRGGHFGEQGRVAVAVAGDHLADPDPARVASERGGRGPALECGFEDRPVVGVEVVEEPDGVEPQAFGRLRHPAHRLELLDRILDVDQVEDPALRDEQPEPQPMHACASWAAQPIITSGWIPARGPSGLGLASSGSEPRPASRAARAASSWTTSVEMFARRASP